MVEDVGVGSVPRAGDGQPCLGCQDEIVQVLIAGALDGPEQLAGSFAKAAGWRGRDRLPG
jgi:hypothetical protein